LVMRGISNVFNDSRFSQPVSIIVVVIELSRSNFVTTVAW